MKEIWLTLFLLPALFGCQVESRLALDGSVTDAKDAKGNLCTAAPVWPGLAALAGYIAPNVVLASSDQVAFPRNTLVIIDRTIDAIYPISVTLGPRLNFENCEVCVYQGRCVVDGECNFNYFGNAGEVTIERADRSLGAGRMAVLLRNVQFLEWSRTSDTEVTGGTCLELGEANLNVAWGK